MEAQRLPNWTTRTADWLGGMAVIFGYEFVCTGLLVICINATKGDAAAIGLCVFFLLLTAGPLTGGHFNPAVSLGVFINKEKSLESFVHLAVLWVAQITGALVGMCLIYNMIANSELTQAQNYEKFPHLMPKTHYYWQAFWLEFITSFVFVMSVLIVKDSRTGEWVHGGNGWLGCFTIAATLSSMIWVSGGHTGASMNPAVSIAQHTLAAEMLEIPNWDDGIMGVYICGPLAGSIAAGFYSWAHGWFIQRYAGVRKQQDDAQAYAPVETAKPSGTK